MPIGVPRIIYCWGEELPAQWTDIYNFIFRRRMVFLMQYLDDELCNQICGLLINIHMEDRSKELEKKEMEKSGLFKTTRKESAGQQQTIDKKDPFTGTTSTLAGSSGKKMTGPSFEDLLAADEDLGIEENNTLEQFTLQKITMEWLNWNAQFFDYSDEPYLFYLADMLSKDFGGLSSEARMLYSNDNNEMSILMNMFKNLSPQRGGPAPRWAAFVPTTPFGGYPSGGWSVQNLTIEAQSSEKQAYPPTGEMLGQSCLSDKTIDFQVDKNKASGKGPPPLFKNFSAAANSSLREKGLQFTKQFFDKISCLTKTDNSNVIISTDRTLAASVSSVKNFPGMQVQKSTSSRVLQSDSLAGCEKKKKNHLDVYSPFRLLANFAAQDYNLKDINPNLLLTNNTDSSLLNNSKIKLLELFNTTLQNKAGEGSNKNTGMSSTGFSSQKFAARGGVRGKMQGQTSQNNMPKLLNSLAQKNFLEKSLTSDNLLKSSEKGLSQRILKKEYAQDKNTIGSSWSSSFSKDFANSGSLKPLNYLDFYSYKDSYNEFKGAQRSSGSRQADKTLQEEEAKKVFVIINSFGGSVGNGITVHDALQFIKAGSLTLGLGVAASAASLALAGGTIGERYVTEGCHVMIHQPEGGIQGQASDIWIDSQEIMKIRLDVAEIYSLATYRPRHKILRDLDRDFYLTATETIHYGLADEIATNEVMHEIIEMTSKVWDYHDSKQQRLLESRESSNSGLDTQAQN
jgi:ATP-dependent Clp protease protease subunit